MLEMLLTYLDGRVALALVPLDAPLSVVADLKCAEPWLLDCEIVAVRP